MYQLLRFAPLLALVLLLPAVLFAQLRELEITPDTSPGTIPVFPNYPERVPDARILVNREDYSGRSLIELAPGMATKSGHRERARR